MKSLIFENIGLKISAVLIAVVLWFFVTSRGQSEMSLDVPIEFRNVSEGLGIVNSSVKSVNVTVRGQERLMKNLKPSDIRVFIDMSKARKGEGLFSIDINNVKIPHAMSVVNVSPSNIRVRLDEIISKYVVIKPVLNGLPERGFRISSIVVEPKQIKIEGLSTEIRHINAIKTEPVDINGLNMTSTYTTNIDTSGLNIKIGNNQVNIKIIVEKRR